MDTPQLLVADVMTLDPVTIGADATLEEATHLCHTNGISGLPVTDDCGALVGVISRSDLVAIDDSRLGRLIRGQPSGLRVGEVMSVPPVTIEMTASLQEAARSMLDERVHRLVVLDDAGRPVGVLSATDFVTLFVDA